jgi:homoserine O-acetyltransferase
VRVDLPEGFTAQHGGVLPAVEVEYEAWGMLSDARDNAVLVIHPLTASPHATGEWRGEERGWWEELIGPGRALDTDRFFVVCPNLLGGCHGTTGPRSTAPDGAPWLGRFPLLTPRDLMRFTRAFLARLGIERPATVVGASMGAMVAWEWAIEAGDGVGLAVVVAAPLRTTAQQIGLNWLQRRGVELDLGPDEALKRFGQMVARGVGMISYRSPLGLEEKFGREWFQPPGATLDARGMFNVESWLRHHGRRSVQSFDPYTYILLSRAMDLHDVGEGRDGIVNALERVRCRTLVVGISSDQLYPAAEVHLGADILNRLGKPVEYAEIRSPHGHDAFLLETGQLGEILRDAALRPPAPVPSPAAREARTVRVAVLGAGRVAGLFARLVRERHDAMVEELGLRLELAGVADVDPARELDPDLARLGVSTDPQRLALLDDVDVVLEVTRGTSVLPILEKVLQRRRPVATTNKSLVREHGAALERLAAEHGTRLAYHNAIAAGWPLIYAVERPLAHAEVAGIQAILSSTVNVVLEQIEAGALPDEALAEAVALGLTEPDPDLDLSGWDSAQKLAMLVARATGRRHLVEELAVRGIGGIDPLLVRGARDLGLRIKLVALYARGKRGAVAGVLPLAVPADGHLGGVRGDGNVVVIDGGEQGEVVHLGRGSGSLPIATAALNDVLGLFHPAHSWTGRYPRAERPPAAPRFARFLVPSRGGPELLDEDAPGAVPLLGALLGRR